MTEGGLYFWSKTPVDDVHFAAALYSEYNVTVLPDSKSGAPRARQNDPGSTGIGKERSSCLR
jgi:aspartate/methionine/tyrosine aminotransferase